jgi:hypothetical protein
MIGPSKSQSSAQSNAVPAFSKPLLSHTSGFLPKSIICLSHHRKNCYFWPHDQLTMAKREYSPCPSSSAEHSALMEDEGIMSHSKRKSRFCNNEKLLVLNLVLLCITVLLVLGFGGATVIQSKKVSEHKATEYYCE